MNNKVNKNKRRYYELCKKNPLKAQSLDDFELDESNCSRCIFWVKRIQIMLLVFDKAL